MATPTYELIETTTLSSSASSVTFSSITQDYRDLVLVVDAIRDSGGSAANLLIRLNGDTGTNYSRVGAATTGSSESSYSDTINYIGQAVWSPILQTKTIHKLEFMDYSATDKHKTVLSRWNSGVDSVYKGVTMLASRWANTSAVNSISLETSTGTFEPTSTFSIYGIAS